MAAALQRLQSARDRVATLMHGLPPFPHCARNFHIAHRFSERSAVAYGGPVRSVRAGGQDRIHPSFETLQESKSNETQEARIPSDSPAFSSSLRRSPGDIVFGHPVVVERTWEEISRDVPFNTKGKLALRIFLSSIQHPDTFQPEEEFLRHYRLIPDHPFTSFIRFREGRESATFGDLPLRHWFHLLTSLANERRIAPLGLSLLKELIEHLGGPPIGQDTRSLDHVENLTEYSGISLLVEEALTEALLEINLVDREREIGSLTLGSRKFPALQILHEHFLVCLPHPKHINNRLRSSYSWFVKMFSVCHPNPIVLRSHAGSDMNSKNVTYQGFSRVVNTFGPTLLQIKYLSHAKDLNLQAIREAVEYSNSLSDASLSLPSFTSFYTDMFTSEFNPTDEGQVFSLSFLLQIQTMSGYGRAWVINRSENLEEMMHPASDNYIDKVCEYTQLYVFRSYEQAFANGFHPVRASEMYHSLTSLAKNTSAGMDVHFQVRKTFSRREAWRRVKSKQKSLALLHYGHLFFTPDELRRTYNTPDSCQTKGARDVPVKPTREVYSIVMPTIAQQYLVTNPLNRYLSYAETSDSSEPFTRGTTHPSDTRVAGKVIIGALEATGSRVMDGSDVFRGTSDPSHLILALDMSNFDKHMTPYNFRKGEIDGMVRALSRFDGDPAFDYGDGVFPAQMAKFAYADGKIVGSLWNGNRRVYRARGPVPDELIDAKPKFRPPPGVFSVRSLSDVQLDEEGDVLVSVGDGSDLATIYTHLSGENSTLVANSLHNMAIGRVIQDVLFQRFGDDVTFVSEMYVGDDTLAYLHFRTPSVSVVDEAISLVFQTVEKCGHVASPAKTTLCPLSTEKTQTHAKQGVYIPQDRMMVISSERKKTIESVSAFFSSLVQKYVTKVSRGFSHDLAVDILLFTSALIGYRKLKAVIADGGTFLKRPLRGPTAGYSTIIVRDPICAFVPKEMGGFGLSPTAINLISTPELLVDLRRTNLHSWFFEHLMPCLERPFYPMWDESHPDPSLIQIDVQARAFSKYVRATPATFLSQPNLRKAIDMLPLQRMGPYDLMHNMTKQAVLKDQSARSLLAPAYERDVFIGNLISLSPPRELLLSDSDGAIHTLISLLYDILLTPLPPQRHYYPDITLSPIFKLQREAFGVRSSAAVQVSFMDKIDRILSRDSVMRGLITSEHILAIIQQLGLALPQDQYLFIFLLLNLDENVASSLASLVVDGKLRFDHTLIARGGICGDEFSMSLDVLTHSFQQSSFSCSRMLTSGEQSCLLLAASQTSMLRATLGLPRAHLDYQVHTGPQSRIFKALRVQLTEHMNRRRNRYAKKFFHDPEVRRTLAERSASLRF
ncbi:putative RNA-dependent RNA polymerase VP1 [St Croix River virus]|uniref:RNA-directed RNA polymerase n=1 Tax=St Croix River virus TaxID=104581 RepID=Q9DSP9_9REOV|nr:putative RNA-dependent RNA polymerase VP1 [St Croix River virus]AAG34363.1 putative RNA-dependent RNA polymerase VP1 [St Croix River virus]